MNYRNFEINNGDFIPYDNRVRLVLNAYKMQVYVNLKEIELLIASIEGYEEKLKDPLKYAKNEFLKLDNDLSCIFEHSKEIDTVFRVLDECTMYTEQIDTQYSWV